MKKIINHPIFLAGFRPLFPLAMIAGILFPFLWGLIFSGNLSWFNNSAEGALNPLAWHAHEMLYGFGWAVLGGFLLTASKNWVKIRGIHGGPLLLISIFWIAERILILMAATFGGTSSLLWILLMNVYMVSVSVYVLSSLLKYRKADSYQDNYFFYLILILFLISKNMLLSSEHYKLGIDLSIGLFRLAFAVMFERTLTQFMKNTESIDLFRHPYLDNAIKILLFISIFYPLFPPTLGALILALAAALLFMRWLLWKPFIGFKKFSNATMYVGYFGLILHLVFQSLYQMGFVVGTATTALHTFTLLCMGIVIPSMLIRICQGHTGRKPVFITQDKLAIGSMLVAAIFRLVFPPLYPQQYALWILISAILWSLCFLLIAIRLIPFCFQVRIDGKEH